MDTPSIFWITGTTAGAPLAAAPDASPFYARAADGV
jgi:hypothetical protein